MKKIVSMKYILTLWLSFFLAFFCFMLYLLIRTNFSDESTKITEWITQLILPIITLIIVIPFSKTWQRIRQQKIDTFIFVITFITSILYLVSILIIYFSLISGILDFDSLKNTKLIFTPIQSLLIPAISFVFIQEK